MNDTPLAPIRRALISVSDKTGITEFAQALVERGVDILSTGAPANCCVRPALQSPRYPITPASPR